MNGGCLQSVSTIVGEIVGALSSEARAAAAERDAVIEANAVMAAQNAESAAERVPANVRFVQERVTFVPPPSASNGTTPSGCAVAFLHCTDAGVFMRAAAIARFDNTCIVESLETSLKTIYSAAAPSAFEAIVRTERSLNAIDAPPPSSAAAARSAAVFTAATRLRQLEAQVAQKITTLARHYGLTVAVAWIDAYARVYDGRVFVTRRELYVEWLRRRWATAMASLRRSAARR